MSATAWLLVRALREPGAVAGLRPTEWDLLIRQARRSGLLARLDAILSERDLQVRAPEPARRHLVSARVRARRHAEMALREALHVRRALLPLGVDPVFLKGAAYLVAGLPSARGRLFGDLDILVPRSRIGAVEQRLAGHGWVPILRDRYDQRYYREWMHELPPLRHLRRKSVLDVHHNILPLTARLKPDPAKLLASAVPCAGSPTAGEEAGPRTLSPADMVLHCATHLFHDGELEHGLRDLVDLDDLLRGFGREEAFWPQLTGRALDLDLARPLYYGLRYASRMLGTPVPQTVWAQAARGGPSAPGSLWMDMLFERALAPPHESCADRLTPTARWLLYVRSHYLRMPLHLLVPHLARKAVTASRRAEA
jgi:hypothetical protein